MHAREHVKFFEPSKRVSFRILRSSRFVYFRSRRPALQSAAEHQFSFHVIYVHGSIDCAIRTQAQRGDKLAYALPAPERKHTRMKQKLKSTLRTRPAKSIPRFQRASRPSEDTTRRKMNESQTGRYAPVIPNSTPLSFELRRVPVGAKKSEGSEQSSHLPDACASESVLRSYCLPQRSPDVCCTTCEIRTVLIVYLVRSKSGFTDSRAPLGASRVQAKTPRVHEGKQVN